MPSIVRGNTNAAVIAIVEKAADILLVNDLAETSIAQERARRILSGTGSKKRRKQ